jgi:peptide/nickel transport system permease protein
MFSDYESAKNVLDLRLFDGMLSAIIFVLLPLLVFLFVRKKTFLSNKLNFSYAVISLLLIIFVMAPIITDENPEFQKNLSVTKLLPPLSSVKLIQITDVDDSINTDVKKFFDLKNKFLKPSFDDKIIYADSVESETEIIYFQKNEEYKLHSNDSSYHSNQPRISSKAFILGTDEFGRDIFSRIIYGSRVSLLVGIGSVLLSLLIGLVAGFIAGYRGGIIDIMLSRFTELFLAFPAIYLVIIILALFGSSLVSIIVVLGVTGWMSLFKIVKSEVVAIKQKDYLITAGLIGLTKTRLLTKEILPVIIAPVLVNLVFQFSNVVLAESALSYLGLGAGTSYPSWGAMIDSGQEYITKAWWLIVFPGVCLILTLFSANYAGRRLNRVINPKANL